MSKSTVEIRQLPSSMHRPIYICDEKIRNDLSHHWFNEKTDVINFKTKIEKDIDSKLGWFDKMKSEWIAELIKLIYENEAIIGYLLMEPSCIDNEYVRYVDAVAKSNIHNHINQVTVANLEQIVKFASQFKLSLHQTFLFDQFTDGASEIKSYYDLLIKYKKEIEKLDENRLRRLKKAIKNVKELMIKHKEDVRSLCQQIDELFKKFRSSTSQIGLQLKIFNAKIGQPLFKQEIAEFIGILDEDIKTCLTYIGPAHQIAANVESNLQKLNDILKKAHEDQMTLPETIRDIIIEKPEPEKFSLTKIPTIIKSKAQNVVKQLI